MQPMFGNELDGTVSWKGGDLSKLSRKPARIRFILNDADIYAFHFAKAHL